MGPTIYRHANKSITDSNLSLAYFFCSVWNLFWFIFMSCRYFVCPHVLNTIPRFFMIDHCLFTSFPLRFVSFARLVCQRHTSANCRIYEAKWKTRKLSHVIVWLLIKLIFSVIWYKPSSSNTHSALVFYLFLTLFPSVVWFKRWDCATDAQSDQYITQQSTSSIIMQSDLLPWIRVFIEISWIVIVSSVRFGFFFFFFATVKSNQFMNTKFDNAIK